MGEIKKPKEKKNETSKKNDIGKWIGFDCKLFHCPLCNKNDFVSDSNNVNDHEMGKMNDSTEEKERMDKKEESSNSTVCEKRMILGEE